MSTMHSSVVEIKPYANVGIKMEAMQSTTIGARFLLMLFLPLQI